MLLREALIRSPLFKDVPPGAIDLAEGSVTPRTYRGGEALVAQNTEGETLYLVARGRARVSRVSAAGRDRLLGYLYAPAVFGDIAVLIRGERHASVVADTELTALLLHREQFEQLIARYPKVLWNLAGILADRVASLNDELIAIGISTEAAMAYVFTNLYRQRQAAGERAPADLPLSQQDLMQRLSASRETVSRVLRKLEREGVVRALGGAVRLLDLARLDALIHGLEEEEETAEP